METIHKLTLSPPLYLNPHHTSKKSPPRLVSLKETIFVSISRKPIFSKSKNDSITSTSLPHSSNPTKLPQIAPKHLKLSKLDGRHVHYSRWAPKILSFKPVLHDRTKSHGNPSDEDEDYLEMKDKLGWFD
jgi:hypothetical protein